MKVLITGGSSFSGYWFIKALKQKGHTITATLRNKKESYTGLRKQRVLQLESLATIIWECSFGDEKFMALLDEQYDVLCHHGAQVENYKSPDFDIAGAFQSNTLNVRTVLEKIKASGCAKVVFTGSVFEAGEGLGNAPMVAFSPYGLSKTISWEIFHYWSWKLSFPLTKFVIPNPFGPFEEPRFCNYLVQSWNKGVVPAINTPDYIRDNIHVDLLADHYALAVEKDISTLTEKYGPSGYIESQGAFATRFAREMGRRLPLACEISLGKQVSFDEPLIRTNGAAAHNALPGWNEQQSWDELAIYYKTHIIN